MNIEVVWAEGRLVRDSLDLGFCFYQGQGQGPNVPWVRSSMLSLKECEFKAQADNNFFFLIQKQGAQWSVFKTNKDL